MSETRIDGPHGAVGTVSPRWFLGYPRGWVVTPDPQPTISGARTESEPPLCPCGARTFPDGEGRKCLNCGGLEQRAREWAERMLPDQAFCVDNATRREQGRLGWVQVHGGNGSCSTLANRKYLLRGILADALVAFARAEATIPPGHILADGQVREVVFTQAGEHPCVRVNHGETAYIVRNTADGGGRVG